MGEKMNIRSKIKTLVASAVIAVAGATTASAVTYSFVGLTNNNVTNTQTGEAQFSVEVTSAGSSLVSFLFENSGPLLSSITQIYFEDGTPDILGGINNIISGAGTDFVENTRRNLLLPGAGGGPNGLMVEAFGAQPTSPVQPNGVNPGEFVEVIIDLVGGATIGDVYSQLNNGDLLVGFHAQGFVDGGSESFLIEPCDPFTQICDPPVTVLPIPAGMPLLLTAFGFFGILMRRRHNM